MTAYEKWKKETFYGKQVRRVEKKIYFFRFFSDTVSDAQLKDYKSISQKLTFLFNQESMIYQAKAALDDNIFPKGGRIILLNNIQFLEGNNFSFFYSDKPQVGRMWKNKVKDTFAHNFILHTNNEELKLNESFSRILNGFQNFQMRNSHYFLKEHRLEPYATDIEGLDKLSQRQLIKNKLIKDLEKCCSGNRAYRMVKSLSYIDNYSYWIERLALRKLDSISPKNSLIIEDFLKVSSKSIEIWSKDKLYDDFCGVLKNVVSLIATNSLFESTNEKQRQFDKYYINRLLVESKGDDVQA